MTQKNIAILFGGCSAEYSVSLTSVSCVIDHLDKQKYVPIMVGISQEGDWYHFTGNPEQIADDTWCSPECCTPVLLSPSRREHKLLVLHKSQVSTIPIDGVFPVMHGRNGEDGTIQGLCELAGIPLIGCGTLACALAMDKDRAHKLVQMAGISAPSSFVLEKAFDATAVLAQADGIGYPLFVKPVKAGSSYGVSKVTEPATLLSAITAALTYDNQAIVEQYIPGFEVGCAVMGNTTLITGDLDEIELQDGFFDFTEKYHLITSNIHVPARIAPEKTAELKRAAKTIYRALGCQGFARVDMFLTPTGEIVFNEVNTIPGFTPHSRFPSMMKAMSMDLTQVITHAIELAVSL